MCRLELSFIFLMYRYFFRFSHVFTADSGNSLGDLIGHSAAVNAISFRPERPFRLVSASEDNSLCFYEGPPFKFKVSLKVNCRYFVFSQGMSTRYKCVHLTNVLSDTCSEF